MEVHAHTHTARKKWTHYLWEFLMLFLAVFCGFLAENFREHQIEHQREKKYMKSLIGDLKTDISKLRNNVIAFQQILLRQDTLRNLYYTLDKGFNQAFYRSLNAVSSYPDFIYSDGTIQQLKSTGSFRLIRNSRVIDSVLAYDAQVKKALINEASLGILSNKMDEYSGDIINGQGFDEAEAKGKTKGQMEAEHLDILVTHDKFLLTKYYNKIRLYHWLTKIIIENMEELKTSAIRLIYFIQTEYHLK